MGRTGTEREPPCAPRPSVVLIELRAEIMGAGSSALCFFWVFFLTFGFFFGMSLSVLTVT